MNQLKVGVSMSGGSENGSIVFSKCFNQRGISNKCHKGVGPKRLPTYMKMD